MIISDLYYEINNDTISTSLLQNIFGIRRNQLERDINLFEKPPSPSKRKTILSQEQEISVLNFIYEQYSSYTPCSPQDIILFASSLIENTLSDGWLQSFIKRHEDSLVNVTALPMDEARTTITQELIEE